MLTQLLDRVRGYAGLEHVTLSVSVSQEVARRLYRAFGFDVYGYEKHALNVGETSVDDEHMVLWLRTPPAVSGAGGQHPGPARCPIAPKRPHLSPPVASPPGIRSRQAPV
jgi:hypothetical protein